MQKLNRKQNGLRHNGLSQNGYGCDGSGEPVEADGRGGRCAVPEGSNLRAAEAGSGQIG